MALPGGYHPRMQQYDVIVIGAGIAGSAAAYALAQDRRVLLLEQHRFLHAGGSSHGGSRIFRFAYQQPEYVALARASLAGWRALERDQHEQLLTETGGLDLGRAGSAELAEIEAAVGAAGLPLERLDPADVARRFPAFALKEGEAALFQPDAGILAATRSVNAFLRGAARRGAELVDQQPVTGLQLSDAGVVVRTPEGGYGAGRLVITAGAWLGQLLADLALPLQVQQQQVLYVRTVRPGDHALGRMPVFIQHDRANAIYGFPLFDDPVAIKIADHLGAPEISLDRRPTGLMAEWAQESIRRARRFLPGLTGELRHFDLCLYTKTPDEQFILDRHPQHRNVVIGGGFSGHGFKFGPALGQALRELSLGEEPSMDLSLFRLDRFGQGQ
jgi:monomeric sarcosine oxidase